MDLKNKKEQLTAQEVELLNNFQMEELEERMEMDGWFKNDQTITIGAGDTSGNPAPPPSDSNPSTPPPTAPAPPTGTIPAGGGTWTF